MVKRTDIINLSSERLLQLSFDAIQDGISVLDANLNILHTNQAMEKCYRAFMPLAGKKCYQVYHGRTEPCSPCAALKTLQSGEPAVEAVPVTREDEQAGWLELYTYPLKNDQGQTIGVVEFARDISARKKMEQLLEESSEWYRTMAEDIPALVTRLLPDLRFTYANQAYCRFYGCKMEEILEKDITDFIPPESRDLVKDALHSLTPGKPIHIHEHINVSHDGEPRWIKWTNRALFDEQGKVKEYLCIGEDIQEQKKVEQELRNSEQRSRALVNAVPDILFLYSRDGVYLDVKVKNDLQLTERGRKLNRAGRLIGSSVQDVLEPAIAEVIMSGIENTLRTGNLQFLQYSYFVKGEQRFFEARMIPAGENEVMSIVRDMTDKENAEKALKESEKRYRDILGTMEEAYYETDLEGNIVFFNDAGLKLFGNYTAKEAKGISYKLLYKDPAKAFNVYNRVFLTGEPHKGLVMEMFRKDGSVFYGEISIALLKDRDGNVKGFKGIGKDVTERIEHEERLEYLSMHDQLTGIYNRAYFENELNRHDKGRDYPITIISADLDGLKLVNDTMGHHAGDKMLRGCATVLRRSLRYSDVVARVGGDEFSALLLRTDRVSGEEAVQRIRENVDEYNRKNEELPLGISLGVATAEGEGYSLRELFKRADNMMYRDKLNSSSSSRSKIVQSLLAALAERDYITEGHARRLEELCRAVGEKIELNSHQLTDLALLAKVHDLGKVGIPDTILYKPGPLTEEEWEVMRGHPEKGFRVAVSSPDLAGIADLILKHHEHWDGSGYPLGLKGSDIPVECRILGIVDAFDVMTNQRPHSNIIKTSKEALKEIKDNAGAQFDPNLVPVFQTVLEEHPEYNLL